MQTFSKDHIIILPHTKQNREAHSISLDEVLATLNEPDHKGLLDDRYTAHKTIGKKHISNLTA